MRLIIVTICFNNPEEVQRTCLSVDRQTRLPDEHWIINGSTDSTVANLFTGQTLPSYRKVINERDQGISDAFNKGIRLAGEGMIQLLNSGDELLHEKVLEMLDGFLGQHPNTEWITGKIVLRRGGHWVEVGKPFDAEKLYRGMRSVAHPSWWVSQQAYSRARGYNSAYKIAMDYDMMCQLAKEPYAFYPFASVRFDDSGISSCQYLASLEENKKVFVSHFGSSLLLKIWQFRLRALHHILETRPGQWLFQLKRKLGGENW
jgi:glycosyltransferase involved in cell wall biosynthesis